MDIVKLLEQLVPIIGQKAVDALAKQIKGLVSDQEAGWQKAILALVADAVEKHGLIGIEIALGEIKALLDGKVPSIDWANIMVASDILSQLQRAEADRKSAARDFLAKIGEILGPLIVAIIRGLLQK